MPIYEYECERCGKKFDRYQVKPNGGPTFAECLICKHPAEKVPSVVFHSGKKKGKS